MFKNITDQLTRIANALDKIAANTQPGGISAADSQTLLSAVTALADKAESIATPPTPPTPTV